MKILFLLSTIPNPRINKRINALRALAEVWVVCIKRLNQDIFTFSEIDGVEHRILEQNFPPQSQILKRIIQSNKYKNFALSKLKEIQPDIIYTEGLDSLIIANQYSKRHEVKVVFEVADLRECFIKDMQKSLPKKVIDLIICKIEKRVFNCVSLLVVTSMKFYDVHFSSFFSKNKVFELPNMLENKVFSTYQKHQNETFTIGFIGVIRYLDQLKMLVDAAKIAGVNVFFAGVGAYEDQKEIENYCKGKNWVEVLGKYNYSQNIASLYGKADCIYAVYDASNANVRIALPNKLYESIYCGVPIIVAKNTYLSELVEQWGVGLSVSYNNCQDLVDSICHLKNDKIFYMDIVNKTKLLKVDMDVECYLKKLVSNVDKVCSEKSINK